MGDIKFDFEMRNLLQQMLIWFICYIYTSLHHSKSFHFALMSIARSKQSILRKLPEIRKNVFQRPFFMQKGKCSYLCVKVSGALFFNLLASQGLDTKLVRIICPERMLSVGKYILRMILKYTQSFSLVLKTFLTYMEC